MDISRSHFRRGNTERQFLPRVLLKRELSQGLAKGLHQAHGASQFSGLYHQAREALGRDNLSDIRIGSSQQRRGQIQVRSVKKDLLTSEQKLHAAFRWQKASQADQGARRDQPGAAPLTIWHRQGARGQAEGVCRGKGGLARAEFQVYGSEDRATVIGRGGKTDLADNLM